MRCQSQSRRHLLPVNRRQPRFNSRHFSFSSPSPFRRPSQLPSSSRSLLASLQCQTQQRQLNPVLSSSSQLQLQYRPVLPCYGLPFRRFKARFHRRLHRLRGSSRLHRIPRRYRTRLFLSRSPFRNKSPFLNSWQLLAFQRLQYLLRNEALTPTGSSTMEQSRRQEHWAGPTSDQPA